MTSSEPTPVPPRDANAPAASAAAVDTAPSVAPMRTRYVVRLGIVGAVALVGLLLLGILPRRTAQRQLAAQVTTSANALTVVSVAAAYRPTSPNTLILPGTLEAVHEVAVYARATGYVRRWHADLGTLVRAGQLLADIDAPELEQNVLQARAQLAQMQSALALARSNYERWRLLAADSAVTIQQLQQMEQSYDAAAASVRAAEAYLRGLVSMLRYTQVTAPFDGIVTARNVDNGSLITAAGASSTPLAAGGSGLASPTTIAAASLFRIAQTDTMRVYVSIPQVQAASVHPGLTADVIVDDLAGRSFPGTVVRTARAIDAATRTMLTEVDVPNGGRVLLPGMNAHVHIVLRRVGTPLVIPSTALVVRAGGPQVMELMPSGNGTATVRFHNVQVGRDNGTTIEIMAGLPDGAMVALIGTQVLTEGQRVRVPPAPSDSARGTAAPPAATPSPTTTRTALTGRDST